MDVRERLAAWKAIAVDAARSAGRGGVTELESAVWTNEEDLFGFFDCFRPDGKGLERVFAGVAGGEEIRKRLLRVYECTRDSAGGGWGYFVVRRPAPATPERLVSLTARHLGRVRQIAISSGEADLTNLLDELPEIEIKRGRMPDRKQPDYDAPETLIYDVVGDWFGGLEPVPSDALLLNEAMYSIACDYDLARYLAWPLYRHSTNIEEPFAPYFDLWTHGARPWFGKPGLATVYVASPA